MKTWLIYNILVCFAVYWASNLLLWFPWSMSTTLGMVLMLTVSPILWAVASFWCLVRSPLSSLYVSALVNGLIFLLISCVSDYLFFGIIRNALDKLYHPTTFYGYAFVISLPFLICLLFSKKIREEHSDLKRKDFISPLTIGMACFGVLCVIIAFDITL